jgi:hypothetical protein
MELLEAQPIFQPAQDPSRNDDIRDCARVCCSLHRLGSRRSAQGP